MEWEHWLHKDAQRKLMDILTRLLGIIFERLWWSERSLRTGRKQRPLWSSKKSASPQSSESWCRVSFCRLSLSTQMTRKQSGVGKEHSLKENHAWPTSLPSTIKQLPRWIRTEQWVFSSSTSARFWTLSCTMLIGKLQKCRLDQWTVRRIENSLNSRSHSIIISGRGFSWSPVTRNRTVLSLALPCPVQFNVFITDLDEDASSVS